jgi:hypothetical protein
LPAHRPIPPKLREANQLYQAGEYEKAASLFAEVGERAMMHEVPQAANLFMRAGIAHLKNQEEDAAFELFKQSSTYCIEKARWQQLARILEVSSAELETAGKPEMASNLRTWVQDKLPSGMNLDNYRQAMTKKASNAAVKLPVNCPKCGGTVNPKEIEWADAANPLCSYCGSILRDEK